MSLLFLKKNSSKSEAHTLRLSPRVSDPAGVIPTTDEYGKWQPQIDDIKQIRRQHVREIRKSRPCNFVPFVHRLIKALLKLVVVSRARSEFPVSSLYKTHKSYFGIESIPLLLAPSSCSCPGGHLCRKRLPFLKTLPLPTIALMMSQNQRHARIPHFLTSFQNGIPAGYWQGFGLWCSWAHSMVSVNQLISILTIQNPARNRRCNVACAHRKRV